MNKISRTKKFIIYGDTGIAVCNKQIQESAIYGCVSFFSRAEQEQEGKDNGADTSCATYLHIQKDLCLYKDQGSPQRLQQPFSVTSGQPENFPVIHMYHTHSKIDR